jgi:hypothetical protein
MTATQTITDTTPIKKIKNNKILRQALDYGIQSAIYIKTPATDAQFREFARAYYTDGDRFEAVRAAFRRNHPGDAEVGRAASNALEWLKIRNVA